MFGKRGSTILPHSDLFLHRFAGPAKGLYSAVLWTCFGLLWVGNTLWSATAWAQEAGAGAGTAAESSDKSLIFGDGKTLWDIFLMGGWVMWPILGVSVIGLAFFFERIIELRRPKHVPKDFDKDLVHIVDTRGTDAGLALCLEKQSSLSRVLYAALLRYGASRQEMLLAIEDEGARLMYDLRRNGRVIGIMSNISPLLGLLGTVLGLITAFDRVGSAGGLGKAELLAGGVAVALLTTAFGLIVAIPLFSLYHLVRGKADDIVREISERATDAIISIDRKSRRSIRPIEDIEENLETKDMIPPKISTPPNLDAEFADQDQDLEKALKTSVTTPAHLPVVVKLDDIDIDREGATKVDFKAVSSDSQPPREIETPENPDANKS